MMNVLTTLIVLVVCYALVVTVNSTILESSGNFVTLILEESPYEVQEPVYFTGSMEIEPGVVIMFNTSTSMKVDGYFTAIGNETHPIMFIGSNEEGSTYWEGLTFQTTSTLSHIVINNAGTGDSCVFAYRDELTINNLEVTDSGDVFCPFYEESSTSLGLILSNSNITSSKHCMITETDRPSSLNLQYNKFSCENGIDFSTLSPDSKFTISYNEFIVTSTNINDTIRFATRAESRFDNNTLHGSLEIEILCEESSDMFFNVQDNVIHGGFKYEAQDCSTSTISHNTFDNSPSPSNAGIVLARALATINFYYNDIRNYTSDTLLELDHIGHGEDPSEFDIYGNTFSGIVASKAIVSLNSVPYSSFSSNSLSDCRAPVLLIVNGEGWTVSYNDMYDNTVDYLVEAIGTGIPIEMRNNYWGIADSKLIRKQIKDLFMMQNLGYSAVDISPYCVTFQSICNETNAPFNVIDQSTTLSESAHFDHSVYIRESVVYTITSPQVVMGEGASFIVWGRLVIDGSSGPDVNITAVDGESWGGIVLLQGGSTDSYIIHGTLTAAGNCPYHSAVYVEVPVFSVANSTIVSSGHVIKAVSTQTQTINILTSNLITESQDYAIEVSNANLLVSDSEFTGYNAIHMAGALVLNVAESTFTVGGHALLVDRVVSNSVSIKDNNFKTGHAIDIGFIEGDFNVTVSDNTFSEVISAFKTVVNEQDCLANGFSLEFSSNEVVDSNSNQLIDITTVNPYLGDKQDLSCHIYLSNNVFSNNAVTYALLRIASSVVTAETNHFEGNTTVVAYQSLITDGVKLQMSGNDWGTLRKSDIESRIIDNKDESTYGEVRFSPVYINSTHQFDVELYCFVTESDSCSKNFECFGVPATSNTDTCSGGGTCIAPNECLCRQYYSGDNCEIQTCPEGFTGVDCTQQIKFCFGKNSTDETICSGHGNCMSTDYCMCDSGYKSAADCSEFDCYGIRNTDVDVCSANGQCTDLDTCQCSPGFVGSSCFAPKLSYSSGAVLEGTMQGVDFPFVEYNGKIVYGDGKSLLSVDADGENQQALEGVTATVSYLQVNEDSVYMVTGVQIRKYNFTSDSSHLYAGGGSQSLVQVDASEYKFGFIVGLTLDGQGNLVVADSTMVEGDVSALVLVTIDRVTKMTSFRVHQAQQSGIRNIHYYPSVFGFIGTYSDPERTMVVKLNSANMGQILQADILFGTEGPRDRADGYLNTQASFNEIIGLYPIPNSNILVIADRDSEASVKDIIKFVDRDAGYVYVMAPNAPLRNYIFRSPYISPSNPNLLYTLGEIGNQRYVLSINLSYPDCVSDCGNGTCVSGSCECEQGYQGASCTKFNCNAVDQCSYNGVCIDANTCNCTAPYFGTACAEVTTCFNEEATDPAVCSSHGQCAASDYCICDSGYSGDSCNVFTCFGRPTDDSDVCGGNGVCTSADTCNCNNNYYGNECQYATRYIEDLTIITTVSSEKGRYWAEHTNGSLFVARQNALYLVEKNEVQLFSASKSINFVLYDQVELVYFTSTQSLYAYNITSATTSVLVDGMQPGLVSTNNTLLSQYKFSSITDLTFDNDNNLVVADYVVQGTLRLVTVNKVTRVASYVETSISDVIWISNYQGQYLVAFFNDNKIVNLGTNSVFLGDSNSMEDLDGPVGTATFSIIQYFDIYRDEVLIPGGYGTSPLRLVNLDNMYTNSLSSSTYLMTKGATFSRVFENVVYAAAEGQLYKIVLAYPECPANCSGNGDCVKGFCECHPGYLGTSCTSVSCELVANCSSNGDCIGPNLCQCNEGWSGSNCTIPSCDGTVEPENNTVCYGNGDCIGVNECSCYANYYGVNCSDTTCFGVFSNNTGTVCSGHGTCVDYDTCECDQGYIQAACSEKEKDPVGPIEETFYITIAALSEYSACEDSLVINAYLFNQSDFQIAVDYFNWTLQRSSVEILSGRSEQETIDLSEAVLTPGYTYVLTVSNDIVNETASASFLITGSLNVVFNRYNIVTRRAIGVVINSTVTALCVSDAELSYEWSILNTSGSVVFTKKNTAAIQIEAYSLPSGNYTVHLQVSYGLTRVYHNTSLLIQASIPSVQISGGDRVVNLGSYTLQAVASDNDYKNLTGATFEWACNFVNGSCNNLIEQSSAKDKPVCQFKPVASSNAGEYEITITFRTVDNRVATDRILVIVSAVKVPVVSLSGSIPKKVVKDKKVTVEAKVADLSQVRLRWTLSVKGSTVDILRNSTTLISSSSARSLVFVPSGFALGTIYELKIEATFTANQVSSFAKAELSLVAPPSGGSFIVTPEDGNELETQFTFSAVDWTTDIEALPLTYSFEYQDDLRVFVPLKVLDSSNVFATQLIRGSNDTMTVRCKIHNSLGAETVVLKSITVRSGGIANTTALVDSLLNDLSGAGESSYKLVIVAKLLSSGVRDRQQTNALLSFIQTPITSGSEDALAQKMTALSIVSKGNSFIDASTLSFVPNLLNSVTPSSGSTLPNLVGGVISNALQVSSMSENIPQATSTLFTSLSDFTLKTVSPGEFALDIQTDSFTMSIQKNYGPDLQDTVVSDASGSVKIPSLPNLNDPDAVVSTEYINFANTSLSLWAGKTENITSSITSFRLLDSNGNKIVVDTDPNNPLVITLARGPRSASNENETVSCQYLNDFAQDLVWSTAGCYVNSTTDEFIVCHCNHTTSFAAFIQFTQDELDRPLTKIQKGTYYVAIIFYIIYFIISVSLFIFLLVERTKQPVRSRSFAPYFCLFAIAVESALIVARNAIQLSKNPTANSLNIIGDVIMFVANPLAIVSLFIFLWQMIRYFVLKHSYHLMGLSRGKIDARKIAILKVFGSNLLFIIVSVVVYALVFVYFLTYSVTQLSLRSKITASIAKANTTALAVSYAGMVLILAVAIVLVFIWDTLVVPLQMHKYEKELKFKETQEQLENSLATSKKDGVTVQEVFKPLRHHFVKDDPLFFRSNALFMVASMLACFISFSIGIASRYQPKSDTSAVMVVALIFDLIYTALRIIAYGAFIAFIRVYLRIKNRNNKFPEMGTREIQANDESDTSQEVIESMVSSPIGYELAKQYCTKEFSLENLLSYTALKNLNSEWVVLSSGNRQQLLDDLVTKFIKSGSEYEVNIPGPVKKSVLKLQETLDEMPLDEQLKIFLRLVNAILTNLSDTFSRFSDTQEFKQFFVVKGLNSALELTLNETPIPRIRWFTLNVELKNEK